MVDRRGRLLLQQRRFPAGTWGLAWRAYRLGESAEEPCRREIWEETGLIAGSPQLINVYSGRIIV
ncbi:NUDIX domain-containing protein [Bacillus infantis]|uniref:NUDIX domain-containing protein n=1 Tax=Bacillus infantis TaxID=324767 RepID=UPI003CE9DA96